MTLETVRRRDAPGALRTVPCTVTPLLPAVIGPATEMTVAPEPVTDPPPPVLSMEIPVWVAVTPPETLTSRAPKALAPACKAVPPDAETPPPIQTQTGPPAVLPVTARTPPLPPETLPSAVTDTEPSDAFEARIPYPDAADALLASETVTSPEPRVAASTTLPPCAVRPGPPDSCANQTPPTPETSNAIPDLTRTAVALDSVMLAALAFERLTAAETAPAAMCSLLRF